MPLSSSRNTQAVLDARTSHQSVLSRLVREQKEGLRDGRGSLLADAECPSPRRDAGRSSTGTSGGGGGTEPETTVGENVREVQSGATSTESSAAPVASNANDAALEEAGPGQDGQAAEEDGMEGELEEAEGVGAGGGSSYREHFSFLSSGFDEATLGGMRTPPFLLPRVIISDGFVQVSHFSKVAMPER